MPNTDLSTLTGTGNTVELATSDKHRLLQSEDRRVALRVLSERRDPIELETLATLVADQLDERHRNTDRMDLATAFHHIHLPLMTNMGVIEYDATTNQIVQSHL